MEAITSFRAACFPPGSSGSNGAPGPTRHSPFFDDDPASGRATGSPIVVALLAKWTSTQGGNVLRMVFPTALLVAASSCTADVSVPTHRQADLEVAKDSGPTAQYAEPGPDLPPLPVVTPEERTATMRSRFNLLTGQSIAVVRATLGEAKVLELPNLHGEDRTSDYLEIPLTNVLALTSEAGFAIPEAVYAQTAHHIYAGEDAILILQERSGYFYAPGIYRIIGDRIPLLDLSVTETTSAVEEKRGLP